MEQIKEVKGSFNSPDRLLWWPLSNSRIISPFWKTEISTQCFSNSWPSQWMGVKELRRKEWVALKRPKQKRMGWETETSWGSSEILKIWTILVSEAELLLVVGLSTESVAPVSVMTGRDSSPSWRKFLKVDWEGRLERVPVDPGSPHHRELGECW